MRLPSGGGIGLRIAGAALAVAVVAVGILAIGVWFVGGQSFADLMVRHGDDAAVAHAMFDESLTAVVIPGAASVTTTASLAALQLPEIGL